jgi:hypothetical protein
MATTTPRADPPVCAIWLPTVSAKPNRARIMVPPNDARWLGLWLAQAVPGIRPQFERKANGGIWTVARHQFPAVASALAKRYGSVACMQDFIETIRCTDSCQFAKSDPAHCECGCMGVKHGMRGADITRADWTDGTLYAYNDFTRRCWVMNHPRKATTSTRTDEVVEFGDITRMLGNVAEDPRQWRAHVHVTAINPQAQTA